eukprot:gene18156-18402_t
MTHTRIFLLSAIAAAAVAGAAHAAPRPDQAILNAAKAAYPGEISLLEQIVNIDSGTGNVEGGEKIQAILAQRLSAIGAKVELRPAEAPGLPPNLVATLTGTGKGRVLLIGHIDTVFEPGEAVKRPFRIEGALGHGPGVMDEKGGVVNGVTALEVLHKLKFKDFAKITLLLETSEEQGSVGTQKLINELVRAHDVELNLEPEAKDTVTVWRKASASLVIKVHGRPAHAGMEPQAGRNAITELMRQIDAVEAAFPRSGDHITVNTTLIKGGSRSNIIPEYAEATLNVRGRTTDEMAQVGKVARDIAAHPRIDGATVEIEYAPSFPPLVQNERVSAVAARASKYQAELGSVLALGGNGGASESAMADAAGTPTLDGLGSTGAGAHTPDETIDLSSVTPRLYVLTRLIAAYGKGVSDK